MDSKYVVFKREEFFQLMGELAMPPWEHANGEMCGSDADCAPIAAKIQSRVAEVSLDDAVVIRRQDLFAPPALASYANGIAVAIEVMPHDSPVRQQLQDVADYFHEQAEKSWNTDYRKIPD